MTLDEASGDERDAVIVVHRAGARGVGPVPAIVVAIPGSTFELPLGDAGDVAAEIGIVFQRLPRQRIMVVADAEETPKAQYRVGHPAAHLVDHHPFDRSNLLAIGAVHGRALDLVAA